MLTQEAAATKPSGLLNHQWAPGPGASLAELHPSVQNFPWVREGQGGSEAAAGPWVQGQGSRLSAHPAQVALRASLPQLVLGVSPSSAHTDVDGAGSAR